jgi:hypothetical protein
MRRCSLPGTQQMKLQPRRRGLLCILHVWACVRSASCTWLRVPGQATGLHRSSC